MQAKVFRYNYSSSLSLPSDVIMFNRVNANQSIISIDNNNKNLVVLPITYRDVWISQFKDPISAADPEGFIVNVGSESGVKYKIIKADCQKFVYTIVYMLT